MLEALADVIADFDVTALVAGRPLQTPRENALVIRKGEAYSSLVLLTSGTAEFLGESPYGIFNLLSLKAPCFIGLPELLLGTDSLCHIAVTPPFAFVPIRLREAEMLLKDETRLGKAFRRVGLVTLARGIRAANQALSRFFDENPGTPKSKPEPMDKDGEEGPVKPTDRFRAGAFLDAIGLDVSILPRLGLMERTYPAGATIARMNTVGREAYFVESGRVRVSVEIPGAGEEALAIVGAGEILGEMALVDDAPRSADLVAHEGPVSVYVLDRAVFQKLLSEVSKDAARLMSGIAAILSRRFEEALKRNQSFHVLAGGLGSAGAWSTQFPEGTEPMETSETSETPEALNSDEAESR